MLDASEQPTRYLAAKLHSPMSATVVARCSTVLGVAQQRRDVFMKAGSADTVSTHFLHCFAGGSIETAEDESLATTRAWFLQTSADGVVSAFERQSRAARVGATSSWLITGKPSPIAQEVEAVHAGFALVMIGTEDTNPDGVHRFERNVRILVDSLTASGVVPVLSTIPPRNDRASYDVVVPEMNLVIRAVAQARQVPYVDLWQSLVALPDRGLASDGIRLNVYRSAGIARPCKLRDDGLTFGMNRRNQLTLEALDRIRRFLLAGSAPEDPPPSLAGRGTWDDPFVIDELPFVDHGDTRAGVSLANRYGDAPQDESGPEIVYRVDLTVPTTLTARVFCDDGVDVDLHWLDAPDPARLVMRADRMLTVSVGPGTHFLALDTFVSGGVPRAGPYRLTLLTTPT